MSPDLKNNLIILIIVCLTLFILYKANMANKIAAQERINTITNDITLSPEEKKNLINKEEFNSHMRMHHKHS